MGVIHRAGETGLKPAYVLIEDVFSAYSHMRSINEGYAVGPDADGGMLIPFVRQTGGGLVYPVRASRKGMTNCSCSTVNAFAYAVSQGVTAKIGKTEFCIAVVGDQLMPADFYSYWQLIKSGKVAKDKDWFRGAARALQCFNAGAIVKAEKVHRGDFIQFNWKDFSKNEKDKESGHSVICYHSRRISPNETRFLYLSAQTGTKGVGVPLNFHSSKTLAAKKHKWVVKQPPDDIEDPAYVDFVLEHGHWYVVTGSDDAGAAKTLVKQFEGGFYRANIARPHVAFPCFPIRLGDPAERSPAFACQESVAEELEEGAATGVKKKGYARAQGDPADTSELFERYYANTEKSEGGFFPIGSARTWHGGVHLYPEGDETVYAPLDGRVVCARFAAPGDKRWKWGSPNFVLLRHALEIDGKKQVFFSLLMHLAQEPWPTEGVDPRLRIPWMRDLLRAPAPGSDRAALGKDDHWKKLHLQVVKDPHAKIRSKEDEDGDGKDDARDLAVGDILELDPQDRASLVAWYGHVGGSAKVKRISDGFEGFVSVGDIRGEVVALDAYPARFTEAKDKLTKGEVVDLWEFGLVVRAGEVLGKAGDFGRPDKQKKALHFEIFSAELLPVWNDKVVIDDCDANLFVDRKKFSKRFFDLLDAGEQNLKGLAEHLIDGVAKKGDGVLTRAEVIGFYNHSADAKEMRRLVTRHPSEWSDGAKWDQLDAKGRASLGYLTADAIQNAKEWTVPYVFWTKDQKSQGLEGLPANGAVYHYHPIRFLEWLDQLRRDEVGAKGSKLHESVVELNHAVE